MNLLSQNNGPIPMPLLSIGTAVDLTNSTYTATTSRAVRISAITDARVWCYNPASEIKTGTGLMLPVGSFIEIPIFDNWVIEVTGSINICNFN